MPYHLPGSRLPALRPIPSPVWDTLPQSPTTFRLVFQSPTTRIYQLDGPPREAVTVPAGSHHITFSFVPPARNSALLGLLAGVALMLVPTARSAPSFLVPR